MPAEQFRLQSSAGAEKASSVPDTALETFAKKKAA